MDGWMDTTLTPTEWVKTLQRKGKFDHNHALSIKSVVIQIEWYGRTLKQMGINESNTVQIMDNSKEEFKEFTWLSTYQFFSSLISFYKIIS